MKNVLITALIVFLIGGGIYFKSLQKEYARMQVIATLEQVEWDLEGVPFWEAHKHHFDAFSFILVLLAAGIYAAWRIENLNSAKKEEARLRRIVQRYRKVDQKLLRLAAEKKSLWDEYERAKARLKEEQKSLGHGEQSPA